MALFECLMEFPAIKSLMDYVVQEPINSLAIVLFVMFVVLFVFHFFACDPDDDDVVRTDYGDINKDAYDECEATDESENDDDEDDDDLNCSAKYHGFCDVKTEEECDAKLQEGQCVYHTDKDVMEIIDKIDEAEQEDLKKNDACFDCDAQNARECLTKQEEGDCEYHKMDKATEETEKTKPPLVLGYKMTVDTYKRLIEKYANTEITMDDRAEDVLSRCFLNRRTYECIIDSDSYNINLLTESNPYYNPNSAYIDRITFSIAGAVVIANGEKTVIGADSNIDIDANGDFSFNVFCGKGENIKDVVFDTVSGNMDFETGILTAVTSRYHEDDNKVYSIIILAAVVDRDFSYEEFMGWRKPKPLPSITIEKIDKKIEYLRKRLDEIGSKEYTEEDLKKAAEYAKGYLLENAVDSEKEEEDREFHTFDDETDKKNDEDGYIVPEEPTMEQLVEAHKIYDRLFEKYLNRHVYEYEFKDNGTKINLIDEINPYYNKETVQLDRGSFGIKGAVIVVDGKDKIVDVDGYVDYGGNFSFDVACGYDDTGYNIIDTVSGHVDFETGEFSASSSRCMIKDKKVRSIIICGTIAENDDSCETVTPDKTSEFVNEDCNYEYVIGENISYANLLKVVDPDLTPAIAHISVDDFKIEAAIIIDDGEKKKVDVNCEIDAAGNFRFDVPCGEGSYETIYDTVHGNINYATGILTATCDGCGNADHKVYSLLVSGTVITFEEFSCEEGLKGLKESSKSKEEPEPDEPIQLTQEEIDRLIAKMREPKE